MALINIVGIFSSYCIRTLRGLIWNNLEGASRPVQTRDLPDTERHGLHDECETANDPWMVNFQGRSLGGDVVWMGLAPKFENTPARAGPGAEAPRSSVASPPGWTE